MEEKDEECREKFGADGCVYESGGQIVNIQFYQADFRETPAPLKLARRYCYKLREGSDTCYVHGNTTSSTTTTTTTIQPTPSEGGFQPTASPNNGSSSSRGQEGVNTFISGFTDPAFSTETKSVEVSTEPKSVEDSTEPKSVEDSAEPLTSEERRGTDFWAK